MKNPPNLRKMASEITKKINNPIKISFKNVNYSVRMPAKNGKPAYQAQILNDCTGYLLPG